MKPRRSKKGETKWYKVESKKGLYYTNITGYKNHRFIVDKDKKPAPWKLLETFEELEEQNGEKISNLIACDGVYSVDVKKKEDEVELPSGTYIYMKEDYISGAPERLVPVNFRTDKYVQLGDITDRIVEDVNNFLNNEAIYRELDIIYKTAVMLFGPGGTGKTSVIRHIVSERLPKDAITIVINDELPGVEFLQTIKSTLANRIKFFILEEFSHFVKDPLDCEGILSFLDGENSIDKSVCFVSTNYPEVLPHNIVSRHSRIEFMHEIGFPNEKSRKLLMNHYLKRNPSSEELDFTEKMTADSIKALCLLTWTKKLSVKQAKEEIEKHLKLSKNNFKGKENKIGF